MTASVFGFTNLLIARKVYHGAPYGTRRATAAHSKPWTSYKLIESDRTPVPALSRCGTISTTTVGIALCDYEKDGRLDILINGLDANPNRLYHNDGNWRFTGVSKKTGVVRPPHNGFVRFFFEYNNGGWPDILTKSLAPWEVVVEALKK